MSQPTDISIVRDRSLPGRTIRVPQLLIAEFAAGCPADVYLLLSHQREADLAFLSADLYAAWKLTAALWG